MKVVKREDNMPEMRETDLDESPLVEEKIQYLLQEINTQQTQISQASQALNLCLSTVEFSESKEQIEFERVLLLASKCNFKAQLKRPNLALKTTTEFFCL